QGANMAWVRSTAASAQPTYSRYTASCSAPGAPLQGPSNSLNTTVPTISNSNSVEASATANASSRLSSRSRREINKHTSSVTGTLSSNCASAPGSNVASGSARIQLPASHTATLNIASKA